MSLDSNFIENKLRYWEKYLKNFHLPSWDTIPDLGLYMEQVIVLLKKYLNYWPSDSKEEQLITAATINNYVRTKIMPKPIKKKYYRDHIAYLIIILTLKQSLSIALIKKIFPINLSMEELESLYQSYIKHHNLTAKYFADQVIIAAKPILNDTTTSKPLTKKIEDLIIASAIVGGLSCLLSEKLILLNDKI